MDANQRLWAVDRLGPSAHFDGSRVPGVRAGEVLDDDRGRDRNERRRGTTSFAWDPLDEVVGFLAGAGPGRGRRDRGAGKCSTARSASSLRGARISAGKESTPLGVGRG
jgi:hypothetical protein